MTLTAPDTSNTGPVMEIVTFRTTDGTDRQAFLNAAKATEALLRGGGDVIRRSLTVDDDGLWTDLVEWRSMAAAEKAAAEVVEAPEFQPFMAMIDPATVTMRHARVPWQME